MRPSEVLHIVDGLPSDYGVIRDQYLGEDPERFVLIFQDDPANWSVRWAIGKTLHHFQWVKVVGQDGSSGPIDTSLTHTIPDGEIRQEVVLYFLKKLCIHPAEYANTLRGKTEIRLIGIEDQDIYNQAYKLSRNQSSFLKHQVKRANAIVRNLLKEMEIEGESFSAVTCCGDMPDLVSEELEKRGISYVIIRPNMSHPSDHKMYRDRLNGKKPSDEEILNEEVSIEAPPKNKEFADKKMEEMKEKARANLINLINSGNILPKIKPLVSSSTYKRLVKIVNSAAYGTKTKAVLVKSELMSLLEGQKKHQITASSHRFNSILRLIGAIGLLSVFVGALFGVGAQLWYQKYVVVLFGIVSIGRFVTKQFSYAFGWLLILLGFIGGYYALGRWGMLVGIVIAVLVWLLFFPDPLAPSTSKAWKEIEKILLGTSD